MISKESGQSLIEVTVALSIAAIVLGVLVVMVLTSFKNAQFAQNQSKATKYAQEAIDKLRDMRDRDTAKAIKISTDEFPFSGLWGKKLYETCTDDDDTDVSIPCSFKFGEGGSLPLTLFNPEQVTDRAEDLGNGLLRIVMLEDTAGSYTTEKKVTVKVIWQDSSGPHESVIQTIITRMSLAPVP